MNEIKCPKCGSVFAVDENDYAKILQQVSDAEFCKRVKNEINNKINIIKMENDKKISEITSKKDDQIKDLQNELKIIESKFEVNKSQEISELEKSIFELKSKVNSINQDWKNKYLLLQQKHIQEINLQKSNFESEIQNKNERIKLLEDYKTKLSTKMLGENLEQHCQTQFNQMRATAFKEAYFEKDNDASKGSKGDFIYRESKDGVEFISIMFEMKNESDTTATKHKNEDFLNKLNKDREAKKCEYAVLVSMLEQDSELYNTGIVDVSYKYPKMYVVRPQFFIPIITLLRNAALTNLEDKKSLARMKSENIDISNFENKLLDFQEKFGKNYSSASRKFTDAINDIDRTIKSLEKTKRDLLSSENQLRLANNKAQDLSIKKLAYGNPTLQKKLKQH